MVQQAPDQIKIVRDGKPVQRLSMAGDYKGNRKIAEDDPRQAERLEFFRQCDEVYDLLRYFPVQILHHPGQECDDVIYNTIKVGSRDDHYTVISNDSDFVQLLQEFEGVTVYNPMKKENVTPPDYPYLAWKALRGDGSDNIKGIPGIGDKRAQGLLESPEKLQSFLQDPEHSRIFNHNYEMIQFQQFSEEDWAGVQSTSGQKDWDVVKQKFTEYEFFSLVSPEGTFTKWKMPFEKFW